MSHARDAFVKNRSIFAITITSPCFTICFRRRPTWGPGISRCKYNLLVQRNSEFWTRFWTRELLQPYLKVLIFLTLSLPLFQVAWTEVLHVRSNDHVLIIFLRLLIISKNQDTSLSNDRTSIILNRPPSHWRTIESGKLVLLGWYRIRSRRGEGQFRAWDTVVLD